LALQIVLNRLRNQDGIAVTTAEDAVLNLDKAIE